MILDTLTYSILAISIVLTLAVLRLSTLRSKAKEQR